MNRCASSGRRALLAPGLALALLCGALPAAAQVTRHFPMNALRGELTVLSATEVLLNGDPARLAPGARLRGQNNMLVISGAAIGQRLVVNYTLDSLGNVKDVWVLRDEEIANRPWPRTPQEAQTWGFNFDTQTWVKP
jgi:hypothetical protein